MPTQTDDLQIFAGMPAVVCSESMRQLLRLAESAARTGVTVLITGESGTGKEIVARAVHHYSARRDRPWVDVNCAAFPSNLIESKLFGYDKGAFSGADSMKPGLFELAHRGTVFLDEIGELELQLQAKLLRVLDGVPCYRLGGRQKVSADVQIVAATNRNLEEAVQARQFREDLYYRLCQVHLRVPPLRERNEDIVPLAEFFLRQHDPRRYFSDSAREAIENHPWPGNVRELRNAVIRSAVLVESFEITDSDLARENSNESVVPYDLPICRLADMERRLILQAMSEANGHQQQAATLLGISRKTLGRKLQQYKRRGVPIDRFGRRGGQGDEHKIEREPVGERPGLDHSFNPGASRRAGP